MWSISDKTNPAVDPANVHPITVLCLWILDIIWYYIPAFIKRIICPIIPVNDTFSGNFMELQRKGILRFILDNFHDTQDIPYSTFRVANTVIMVVTNAVLAKKILLSSARRGSPYTRLREFFGDGIFTDTKHDNWVHQKSVTMKLLHGESLKSLSRSNYKILLSECRFNKKEIDLVKFISRTGMYMFCDIVLGVNVRILLKGLQPKIYNCLRYINGSIEPITVNKTWVKLLSKINNLLEPTCTSFEETHNKFEQDRDYVYDFISRVIDLMKLNAPASEFATEVLNTENKVEQIQLLLSMMFGNLETTSRLLTAAFYLVLKHPKYIEQIRSEVDLYDNLDYNMIMSSSSFPNLKNIIRESSRLYPPVWILSRTCQDNLQIGDYIIKKGVSILISPLLIQRSKSLWGDDAESFRPERFIGLDKGISKMFYPFIVGNGMCPADKYVELECCIFLGCLFKNFDISLVNENTLPCPKSVGTLRLLSKLPVTISKRDSNKWIKKELTI